MPWHVNKRKQLDEESALCIYARVQLQEMDNIERITHQLDIILIPCNFSFIWQHIWFDFWILLFVCYVSFLLSVTVTPWGICPTQERKFSKEKSCQNPSWLTQAINKRPKRLHVQLLPWQVVKVLRNHFQRANGTYLGSSLSIGKTNLTHVHLHFTRKRLAWLWIPLCETQMLPLF